LSWGLNSGLHTCKAGVLLIEPHLQSIFIWLFWRWSSQTVCPCWPWTVILLISASRVARMTGMSHCPPALLILLTVFFKNKHFQLWYVYSIFSFMDYFLVSHLDVCLT
jgi:hypothetical protein